MSFFSCLSPKKEKKGTTRTGKPVGDSRASDLYAARTMPPISVLSATKPEPFTDFESRTYWKVSAVKGFVWEKEEEIRKDGFDAKTDELYFVRSIPGKSLLMFPPPEKNLTEPLIFYGEREYKGFIVDNGYDEIYLDATARGLPRTRATSFVVIRWVERPS